MANILDKLKDPNFFKSNSQAPVIHHDYIKSIDTVEQLLVQFRVDWKKDLSAPFHVSNHIDHLLASNDLGYVHDLQFDAFVDGTIKTPPSKRRDRQFMCMLLVKDVHLAKQIIVRHLKNNKRLRGNVVLTGGNSTVVFSSLTPSKEFVGLSIAGAIETIFSNQVFTPNGHLQSVGTHPFIYE